MERRTLIAGAALAGSLVAGGAAADSAGLIGRFAATLSAHDMAGFAALFGEDYVNHQVSAAAPDATTGKTPKQGVVGFFQARLVGMPDLKVVVEASVAAGDKVAASFVYSGTHGGVYFGFAPTGRALRFTSCDIFRVRNGRFVEHWGMGDIAGVLAQLRAS